jgi:hypothetical protein
VGLEGSFTCTCDKDMFPTVSGGGYMSARDLARYGLIFARMVRRHNFSSFSFLLFVIVFVNRSFYQDRLGASICQGKLKFTRPRFSAGRGCSR